MSISKERKKEIIENFKISENDTGSVEVQIAILTERISNLTEHLKIHRKDIHTRYGLQKLVSKRKKLLKYLKREKPEKYQEIIRTLGIRGV
ncbi:MAG: 30S ribosomal protein S15 [candidate division WOR-3 bacterium]|nr:30S ribosomal protein S15 [candidate division WOR-3 bacterium]MCX7948130.1 30S ribosomal protein S15 [candidate division WOR-3 bacterium]MDW8150792.1 30S ribosomal protein S15 [candidate division WOR-3 bacterium]